MKVGDERSYMKGTSSENDLQTANYPLLDEWNGFGARNMGSAVSNVFPVVASQFSGGEK